jgi:cell division protease FtsH
MAKNLILWLVIAVVLMSVFQNFSSNDSTKVQTDYTRFLSEVKSGNINRATIDRNSGEITGVKRNGDEFVTYIPYMDMKLMDDLVENNDIYLLVPDDFTHWCVDFLHASNARRWGTRRHVLW